MALHPLAGTRFKPRVQHATHSNCGAMSHEMKDWQTTSRRGDGPQAGRESCHGNSEFPRPDLQTLHVFACLRSAAHPRSVCQASGTWGDERQVVGTTTNTMTYVNIKRLLTAVGKVVKPLKTSQNLSFSRKLRKAHGEARRHPPRRVNCGTEARREGLGEGTEGRHVGTRRGGSTAARRHPPRRVNCGTKARRGGRYAADLVMLRHLTTFSCLLLSRG